MLTLYDLAISSYGCKTRILLRHKNLSWHSVAPPDGYGSAAYCQIVPAGTIPALDDNGFIICDSEAIAEYLDTVFSTPPMRPDAPQAAASAREISRFHDTRIEPLVRSFFSQVTPANRDAALIAANAALLQTRLDDLAAIAAPAPLMTGDNLAIADCGFVASFTIIALLQDILDLPVTLPPAIATYRESLLAHPDVAGEYARYRAVLDEWAATKLNA